MSEKPGLRQVQAVDGRRHHGQLHDHSVLAQDQRFSTSGVHTGAVFTAELERLSHALQQWQKCADDFAGTLQRITLAARIQDGSGPVANALGTRFNHRIATAGGIGYAADAYLAGLQQIL
jgi:hypothetical protein